MSESLGVMGRLVTVASCDQEARVGTVAVLLAGRDSDQAVLSSAVSIAIEWRARISILAVPRRVPIGAHCGMGAGYTSPFSAMLRAEALADAARSARRAADFVPADIPAEYAVIPGSPIRAMKELVERKAVAHIVLDRSLLARRPRLRRASDRWAQAGMLLKIV
jgi:hypothetical protein